MRKFIKYRFGLSEVDCRKGGPTVWAWGLWRTVKIGTCRGRSGAGGFILLVSTGSDSLLEILDSGQRWPAFQ